MGIRLVCGKCSAVHELSGVAPGTRFTCTKCGTDNVVPGDQADPAGIGQSTLAGTGDDREVNLSAVQEEFEAEAVPNDEVETALRSGGGTSGKYIVKGLIGKGGMGEVLLCVDRDIRRSVAIKKILPHAAADPNRRARFVEEIQVTGQLEHPNIVPVYELGRDAGGDIYYAMKLVKGKSLADLLKQVKASESSRVEGTNEPGNAESKSFEPLSLSELLHVFLKVCDGIAFAHSKGVIHRDLKPENIMVGDFGEVLVMDWGLAKVRGREDIRAGDLVTSERVEKQIGMTMEGATVGTPAYMPPEQAEGKLDQIDQRSDVYSLGAILYEILTLERAIEAPSPLAALIKVVDGDIVPPHVRAPNRQIPRELSAIAMKCLSKKREDRYQSVGNLQKDIRLFMEGRSVSAAPDTLLQGTVKLIKRNKALFGTIGAAAGVLIAIGVFSFLRVMSERNAALLAKQRAEQNERVAASAKREAEQAKEEVVRNARLASERFSKQALRMVDEGRMKEAELRADDAVQVCPQAPYGLYALGMLAQAQDKHDKAVEYFREALKRDPKHEDSKLAMSRSLQLLGQLAKLEDENEALQEDKLTYKDATVMPDDLDKIDRLVDLTKKKDTHKETIASTDWRALLKYADTLLALAKYEEAREAYDDALVRMTRDHADPLSMDDAKRRRDAALIKAMCSGWYAERDKLKGDKKASAVISKIAECTWTISGPQYYQVGSEKRLCVDDWKYEVTQDRIVSMSLVDTSYARDSVTQFLDPLKGLDLTSLKLKKCKLLWDLSPLKGMPLRKLSIEGSPMITDISPLKGAPLEELVLTPTKVSDLSPLKDMPLQLLELSGENIKDISPLKGMPLKKLTLTSPKLEDVSALKGMPLESLTLNCENLADISALSGLPLKSLSIASAKLTSIVPLKGLRLETLSLSGNSIRGFEVLEGMPIKILGIHCEALGNLNFLQGMKLERLDVEGCIGLSDISAIKGMPITHLNLWDGRSIRDISVLKTLPLVELKMVWDYTEYLQDPTPAGELDLLDARQGAVAMFLRRRQLEKAEGVCVSIARKWPNQDVTPTIAAIAEVFIRDGKLDESLKALSDLESLRPQPSLKARTCFLKARIALEQGDNKKARELLGKLFKEFGETQADQRPVPESVAAAYILEEMLDIGKDLKVPTETDLLEAPPEPVFHDLRGVASFDFKQPNNFPQFVAAARHILAGEKDEAMKKLKECIEYRPDNSYGAQAVRMLAKLKGQN